ncbi:hypothetical protein O5D80_004129 [Batrachochytrium dendrobatidis]|nr:hypothetical protein O5D80_004129 [Batrachochytrium dendrobatidis]
MRLALISIIVTLTIVEAVSPTAPSTLVKRTLESDEEGALCNKAESPNRLCRKGAVKRRKSRSHTTRNKNGLGSPVGSIQSPVDDLESPFKSDLQSPAGGIYLHDEEEPSTSAPAPAPQRKVRHRPYVVNMASKRKPKLGKASKRPKNRSTKQKVSEYPEDTPTKQRTSKRPKNTPTNQKVPEYPEDTPTKQRTSKRPKNTPTSQKVSERRKSSWINQKSPKVDQIEREFDPNGKFNMKEVSKLSNMYSDGHGRTPDERERLAKMLHASMLKKQ